MAATYSAAQIPDVRKMLPGLTSPSQKYLAVTTSDSAYQDTAGDGTGYFPRGLYVGGAGNVVLVDLDGSTAVTFTGVTAGSILPVCFSKCKSTGTTATSLVALY